jgi:hypothetical protein
VAQILLKLFCGRRVRKSLDEACALSLADIHARA